MAHRFAISLPVVLYARGSVFAHGVSRNIGLSGMYIQMEPGLLHRNTMIEVEVPAMGLRIPALVIHCDEEGVGLSFEEAATLGQMRYLRQLLLRLAK